MVAEATTKPVHHHSSSSGGDQKQQHKQLDREVRDMVSAITSRVSHLHKDGSGHGHEDFDDEHGVRIITLSGTNTGATMKSEFDEKAPNKHQGGSFGEHEALRTYVNSNFQAINNSIMMGGSYTTNDPGVHIDIADMVGEEHGHGGPHGHKVGKKEKKKKKDKESSKSDQHSE